MSGVNVGSVQHGCVHGSSASCERRSARPALRRESVPSPASSPATRQPSRQGIGVEIVRRRAVLSRRSFCLEAAARLRMVQLIGSLLLVVSRRSGRPSRFVQARNRRSRPSPRRSAGPTLRYHRPRWGSRLNRRGEPPDDAHLASAGCAKRPRDHPPACHGRRRRSAGTRHLEVEGARPPNRSSRNR
jgi:hypothetical protein